MSRMDRQFTTSMHRLVLDRYSQNRIISTWHRVGKSDVLYRRVSNASFVFALSVDINTNVVHFVVSLKL